jgi:hypothetical protein
MTISQFLDGVLFGVVVIFVWAVAVVIVGGLFSAAIGLLESLWD